MAFLDELFERLWTEYVRVAPVAGRVHGLLRERGPVRHDHVALRTFDLPEVEIEALDRGFVACGYQAARSYELVDEKLVAYHYEHEEPGRPKVFVSALVVDELSAAAQETIRGLVAHVEPGAAAHPWFAGSGRHWPLSGDVYRALRAESEYAAWVAAFGFRAHHFAVDVESLTGFADMAELHRFLAGHGVALDGGGAIRGSAAELLERSATAVDEVELELADGPLRVPSGSYEFARRYRAADGSRFEGFASESAS